MQIGDKVTYIRHSKDGVSEGEAKIKGIGLDGESRAIVLLVEGDNSFNTYTACVNPTEDFKEQFTAMVTELEELSKEGNDKAKAIVEQYNGKISVMRDALIGSPVEL